MGTNKIKVGVLFGGKSPEHMISLLSARSVIDKLDRALYDCHLIGISSAGTWSYYGTEIRFVNEGNPTSVALPDGGVEVLFGQSSGDHKLYDLQTGQSLVQLDVLFPVLHGLHGEDGAVQGLAKLAGVPMVGCDTLGAAVCMDKEVTKRLLRDADVLVADFVTIRKGAVAPDYDSVAERLGAELYVKPVNLGSSVGVSFADSPVAYERALTEAFQYDRKVVVEAKVVGREIECAVLGNDEPKASVIGEVAPTSEFYTFDSKYVDKEDAQLSIPADISEVDAAAARKLAVRVFTLLECKGFARVDMFLQADGQLIVNEVNTIPGFTSISMYPKLWESTGLPYKELLSRLIDLAMELHKDQSELLHAVS